MGYYHMQVHPSGSYISTVISSPNHTSLSFIAATFLITYLRCCNHLGILSSTAEILLFNLVFYDRVTLVSVSTLKPLLRIIGALLLKP